MKKSLIRLKNADVALDGRRVLFDISWELCPGEHWAVIGANGAGKSTFLKLLRGDLWPEPAEEAKRIYNLDGGEQEAPAGIKDHIALVTPEFQDAYTRNGWDLTGEEVVLTGFSQTVWLHEKPSPPQVSAVDDLFRKLDIAVLRRKSILLMSRGEARKILIARALVSRPKVLLLDEPCNGLDIQSERVIFAFLEEAAGGETQLVIATHRLEEVARSVSHVLILKDGAIEARGMKEDIPAAGRKVEPAIQPNRPGRRSRSAAIGSVPARGRECLIRIENASVYLGDDLVLNRINWRVNAGENWAVFGRNGAGKSTLLRLLAGELHPALGGRVVRFGEEGGSLWEMKSRIGYVSPELQAGYDEDLTGEEVVLSGLFSSIGLYHEATSAHKEIAREVMAAFRLERLAGKKAREMSYGEMRKILIARAAAARPRLLVLDEPASGLDRGARMDFLGFLERVALSGTAIVMATHHPDELMPSITHILVLSGGRAAARGRREKVKGSIPA